MVQLHELTCSCKYDHMYLTRVSGKMSGKNSVSIKKSKTHLSIIRKYYSIQLVFLI